MLHLSQAVCTKVPFTHNSPNVVEFCTLLQRTVGNTSFCGMTWKSRNSKLLQVVELAQRRMTA
jgi:hypothetical protein